MFVLKPKTCIRCGSTIGFSWTFGVNNSKMVDTEQSYQGKHILAMFSNRQNGSECPKSVPCDVTPVTQRALKIDKKCFLGKSTINRKNQNFATKRFVRTPIHVFLPSFAKIGKAQRTKRVHGKKVSRQHGRFCVGAGGTCPPPRFKSYSWPFWRDLWGSKMLQNPNFRGSTTNPLAAYSAPQNP